MSGRRLVRRLATVLLGTLGLLLFLHAVDADAENAAVGSRPSAVGYNLVIPSQIAFHDFH
jgi:hypothetical protein